MKKERQYLYVELVGRTVSSALSMLGAYRRGRNDVSCH